MSCDQVSEALDCYQSLMQLEMMQNGRRSEQVAHSLMKIWSCHLRLNQLDRAANDSDAAIDIFDSLGLTRTDDYAAALLNRGVVCGLLGEYERALDDFTRCLALQREVLPANDPQITATLELLAASLTILDREAEAEAMRAECTAIQRRSQINCAGPGCARHLREDGAPLDVCVKCSATFYCGKACQTADWKREGATRRSARR